ncbi:MAG: hypothetical protein FWJ70_09425, partial [Micromonosporaceae bacterium]
RRRPAGRRGGGRCSRTGGALLADAVTFAVVATVLLLVRPRWPRERATGATVLADVRAGCPTCGAPRGHGIW